MKKTPKWTPHSGRKTPPTKFIPHSTASASSEENPANPHEIEFYNEKSEEMTGAIIEAFKQALPNHRIKLAGRIRE